MFLTPDADVSGKNSGPRRAERLLLCCIALSAFLVILTSAPLIASRYQIDYGEGLMLDGALRILHSQPLYPNPFSFPVVIHVYGPVAYAAIASVLPGGAASFPAGRILILACCLVLSSLIVTILRRLTDSRWIGLSFGILLLTLPAFRFWFYLMRADLIGLVFSVLGIALYLSSEKRWYWSIPFFELALFCKYSLLAAPVAVLFHMILNRNFKRAAVFGVGLFAGSALAFTILEIRTGGWFAFHMFSSHPDPYSLAQFFGLGAVVWASAPVVTALAAWYVAADLRERKLSFGPVYFAASALTSLTAGKLGSTTNHFIEWMIACCICAGLGYAWLRTKYPAKALPVAMLLSASALAGAVSQVRPSLQVSRELQDCGAAYQYVSNSPSSRVLSESLGPLLVAEKPILVSDPFEYGQFVKHGLWPDRRIEELLNERYFGLVVMGSVPLQTDAGNSDVWPKSLLNAIARNYRTVDRFNCRDAGVMLEPVFPRPVY
jgi:hypothetical protein